MQAILGLNAYHGDSAAALVVDGELVAAAEEERFNRIKHWAGFPRHAIQYCLEAAGIRASDLTAIAVNTDRSANASRKLAYVLRERPSLKLLAEKLKGMGGKSRISTDLEAFFGAAAQPPVVGVEHHIAHLASAFLASPFQEAAVVSVDGFGDFASAAWGFGSGSDIQVDGRVLFPHSLGIFYMAMTQHLGFPHWGDEYKVMGLAPYGVPNRMEPLRKLLRITPEGLYELDTRYFIHHRAKVQQWPGNAPSVDYLLTPEACSLLGPRRSPDEPLDQQHRDLAASVQALYEEAFFALLARVHRQHPVDCIALAGGCAMNSVANGKVQVRSPFRHVYVQAAAGDAGGAIGAALWLAGIKEGEHLRIPMTHAYWGPLYSDEHIRAELEASGSAITAGECTVRRVEGDEALCELVAGAIANGSIVGWFQGRMEWGPRALGNRSILADPRRGDMKDILNRKIKRRESFRPFAPSVLRERVLDWFELDGDVPFMTEVYPIRAEKRHLIPAVTHVDGTGRLQTVSRDGNPLYHRLINAFERQTGVPMVLNTSFNENEPVVCQPSEALACFLRTRMDMLVMNSWVVSRND